MPRIKRCSFRNCTETSLNVSLRFFHFRDHDCDRWIQACEKQSLYSKSRQSLLRRYFVCSKHFVNKDFTRPISPFKLFLTKDATPVEDRLSMEGKFCLCN